MIVGEKRSTFAVRDLLSGDDEPRADTDTDEEQLTEKERRELEFVRKEQMRRDLLAHGYGGIRRDVFRDL